MKEIKIYMHLQELKDKVRKYLPRVEGGYYLEIFFASNRVVSKPFRVSNGNIPLYYKSKKNYKLLNDEQKKASGEIKLNEIIPDQDNEVDIVVESALFAKLRLSIEVIENVIEKEIIIENDEDLLKKEEIDYEERERLLREEERLKREAEELEALRLAQAKKMIITVTDFTRENESYF